MEDEQKRLNYGVVLALFSIVTLINNSLAPKCFRQELFNYNLKFYGIVGIMGLLYVGYMIIFKGKK